MMGKEIVNYLDIQSFSALFKKWERKFTTCLLLWKTILIFFPNLSREGKEMGFHLSSTGYGPRSHPFPSLVHMNDIADSVTSEICLFADDRVCYREIKDPSDCQQLQWTLINSVIGQTDGACGSNQLNAI